MFVAAALLIFAAGGYKDFYLLRRAASGRARGKGVALDSSSSALCASAVLRVLVWNVVPPPGSTQRAARSLVRNKGLLVPRRAPL